MTVDDLRRALEGVPGHYRIWISYIGDEVVAGLVTQERTNIRICDKDVDRVKNESVLYEEASGS
jgi:hypothetical protein